MAGGLTLFALNCLRLTFEPPPPQKKVKLISCVLKALGLSTFTNIKKHNW